MKKIFSLFLAVILFVGMPIATFAKEPVSFTFTEENTKTIQQAFDTTYQNAVLVVPTWSLSDVEKTATGTVTMDLTNFDKDSLVFYDYSLTNSTLGKIESPGFSVDAKSNVTFTTSSNQGFVIVSSGILVKKEVISKEVTPKEVVRTVHWVINGKVYHSTSKCRTLSRSVNIQSGSIKTSGKPRGCKVCY